MISVVVPTRNSRELENCLGSLRSQRYKNFELIVVAPRNDAATKLAKKFSARIVYDELLTIGNAYHVGAKSAKGKIIAFIDADATAPKHWLANIAKGFENKGIDILGGEDLLPKNSSGFQQAAYQIDLARKPDKAIYGEKAKKRLRAANIAFKKGIFTKFNFNRKLKGLQEPELLHRLSKAGYEMKFDPGLYVYHQRRNSLKEIFHQIYRNGIAKIELVKLHKDMISFIDVAPFIAVLYGLLLLVYLQNITLSFLYWLTTSLIYFIVKPALILVRTGKFSYYPLLFPIVLTREIAYALGILVGIKNIFRKL